MLQGEGDIYITYAYRFADWMEVAHFLNGATSSKIQTQLRRYFASFEASEQISTNGGASLVSAEMDTFYVQFTKTGGLLLSF